MEKCYVTPVVPDALGPLVYAHYLLMHSRVLLVCRDRVSDTCGTCDGNAIEFASNCQVLMYAISFHTTLVT